MFPEREALETQNGHNSCTDPLSDQKPYRRKQMQYRKGKGIFMQKQIGIIQRKAQIQTAKKGKRKVVHFMAAALFLLSWGTAGMTAFAATGIHSHTGSEEEGGGCYQTPVYHTHQGTPQEGGACYQTPVYHVHEGSAEEGGGCYGETLYHTHEGNETEGGDCYTAVYHSHTGSCYAEGKHTASCPHHTEYHSYDCGTVHDWDGDGHGCDGFVAYDCGGHQYLACGMSDQIEGYTFTCTETEDTIIGYGLDCGKTEEDVEYYELTCTKTEQDIDYYEKTCGMEEGEEYEIPDPVPEQKEEPKQDNDSSGNDGSDDSGEIIEPVPTLAPTPLPTPEIQEIKSEETLPLPIAVKTPSHPEKAEQSPTPLPTGTATPSPKKTVQSVKVSPVKAQPDEEVVEPEVIEKTSPFLTPVGKVISITSGTLVTALLLGWLIFYLRHTVRVYNDNGKGRMHYLGRASVVLSEEGYCIQLSDRLIERAVTNRYRICPDLFLLGKNNSWEVFIVKEGKKKAVYLEKEIRITI